VICRNGDHLGAACRTPGSFFLFYNVEDSLGLFAVVIPLLIIILGEWVIVPPPKVPPPVATVVELKVPP
jgi:hypothetical protein